MVKHRKPHNYGIPEFPVYFGRIIKDKNKVLKTDGISVVPAHWNRHAAFLYALYSSAHTPPDAAQEQSASQIQAQLSNSFINQHRQNVTQFPHASFGIVVKSGTPIGRLSVIRDRTVWEVLELSLLPHWQSSGIAQRLLDHLSSETSASGLSLITAKVGLSV